MTNEVRRRGRPRLPAQGAAGETIRAYREAMGITLHELSLKTGLSKSSLSDIERGVRSPTVKTLERIAVGLGADLDVLLRPQLNQGDAVQKP